jgi:hypothetical protein
VIRDLRGDPSWSPTPLEHDPDNVAGVQYVVTLDPTIDPTVVLA